MSPPPSGKRGEGPIAPNEERLISMEDADGRSATVRPIVTLAVFADGVYEGSADAVAEDLARRDENARAGSTTSSHAPLRASSRPSTFIWSEPGSGAQIVASIENRGSFAIQAFGIEVVGGDKRPRLRMGTDYCCASRAPRGDGSIEPGETREVNILVEHDAPQVEWPNARLYFVQFTDGTFEGSRAARDELLKHRAQPR